MRTEKRARVCEQPPWRRARALGGAVPGAPDACDAHGDRLPGPRRRRRCRRLDGHQEGSVPAPWHWLPSLCLCLSAGSWPAASLPLQGRMLGSPAAAVTAAGGGGSRGRDCLPDTLGCGRSPSTALY